jgi:hypothetical protein
MRVRYLQLLCAALLLVIVTSLVVAASVRHALVLGTRFSPRQIELIEAFASAPSTLIQLALEFRSGDKPIRLLRPLAELDTSHWSDKFPQPSDKGYLLVSSPDEKSSHANVRLLRIADGKVVAKWQPNWDDIIARTSASKWFKQVINSRVSMAMHPLVLPGGDIVFNTQNSLVRLGACDNKIVWHLDEEIHHSIEFNRDKTKLWVNGVSDKGFGGNATFQNMYRDDSLMLVDLNGKVEVNLPVSDILIQNGLSTLLFGAQGLIYQPDPIHLNNITEAETTTRFWQAGDLLVSSRHLSTVFIYRPSTKKIVWHKQGPWLHQHAPYFVGDSKIILLDNNVVDSKSGVPNFREPDKINRVMEYDFATDTVTEPYRDILLQLKPKTPTQGRVTLLDDGSIFFEETDFGRMFRGTRSDVIWSYINYYGDDDVGRLGWTRYLKQEEGERIIADLKAKGC